MIVLNRTSSSQSIFNNGVITVPAQGTVILNQHITTVLSKGKYSNTINYSICHTS